MDLLNILYTPLDTEVDIPEYDRDELYKWMSENRNQYIFPRKDASERLSAPNYPWNITYARHNCRWRGNFHKRLPELADYFCKAFNLKESDVNTIVLLPTKDEFEGVGFWHADADEAGLRIYLENDDFEKDFLLIKPTIENYNSREELGFVPDDGIDSERFRDEIHVASILRPRQAFFLNNIRAIHAAKISKIGKKRIAVLITLSLPWDKVPNSVKDLIARSAIKYKDLSIIRQD